MPSTTPISEPDDRIAGEFPPGPSGVPLLGNAHQFVGNPDAFYDRLAEFGDVVAYRLGGMQFCTLLHPEHVEQALVTDSEKFSKWNLGEFGPAFAPDGILFTEGEQWKRQRTQVQPAFQLDRIRSYAESMTAFSEDMVDGWAEGEVVPATEAFSDLTLRILAKSLFDLDLDESDRAETVTEAADAVNELADPTLSTLLLPKWVPTPSTRRFERAMREFETVIDDLVAARKHNPGEHDDLLAMLMRTGDDGDGMADTELRDTMVTFLFAGHETTSLALTYTNYLLATHPGVAERLRAEIDEVVGDDRPGVTDLPRMPYLDKVVTESLRLYPPAYVLFREASEDVEIGRYTLPAGTKFTLPQFRIHYDERWFDEPETFDPSRWTDEFEASLPEYAYFPFGGGPRHCIGMRFAMLELKLVLVTLCQRVRFEYAAEEPPEPQLLATYQPNDEVSLRVARR
ncbi:cytochrome P450 [Haloarchaeobius sp. DFWS5]|uniref:cytochrome P450 n=1 Tax=Haloarchaeobius sp. DFWS5 TaxID=3446114 RepID=UPI003EB81ECB